MRISWKIVAMLPVIAICRVHSSADSLRLVFPTGTKVANQEIEESVLESFNALSNRSEQIGHLLKLVEISTTNESAIAAKSSALRLLGKCGDTNAIAPMIQNLTFMDTRTKTYPAVQGLGEVGESAVDPIFRYIRETADPVAVVRGAEAIQRIKCQEADCSEYFKWLAERFDTLPKNLQQALGIVEH